MISTARETSSHLAEIREYLRKRERASLRRTICRSPLYRAIHTLSGSSKMAEARHGIRITETAESFHAEGLRQRTWIDRWRKIATLADAVSRPSMDVVSHINEFHGVFFAEQPSILARLHQLEIELDAETREGFHRYGCVHGRRSAAGNPGGRRANAQ